MGGFTGIIYPTHKFKRGLEGTMKYIDMEHWKRREHFAFFHSLVIRSTMSA